MDFLSAFLLYNTNRQFSLLPLDDQSENQPITPMIALN